MNVGFVIGGRGIRSSGGAGGAISWRVIRAGERRGIGCDECIIVPSLQLLGTLEARSVGLEGIQHVDMKLDGRTIH